MSDRGPCSPQLLQCHDGDDGRVKMRCGGNVTDNRQSVNFSTHAKTKRRTLRQINGGVEAREKVRGGFIREEGGSFHGEGVANAEGLNVCFSLRVFEKMVTTWRSHDLRSKKSRPASDDVQVTIVFTHWLQPILIC